MKHYLLTFLLVVLVACKKYPDGPGFSLQPKKWRLSGTWQIDVFYVNKQDLTTAYFPQKLYWESYDNNGDFEYTDGLTTITQKGKWRFQQSKTHIYRTAIAGPAADVEVLRLTAKEFWYTYTSNNQIYEAHLVQN